MRKHHTKNKGDIGVIQAIADLATKGWGILVPLTEHEAFDIVAYRAGRFLRVQVKYRAAVNGAISFNLSTCWADRHGVHSVPMDLASIDLICIYCPDTATCYYVDPQRLEGTKVSMRISPARNYQVKRITWAKDCAEIPTSVCGVPGGLSSGLERTALVRHSREPRAVWLISAHSSAG